MKTPSPEFIAAAQQLAKVWDEQGTPAAAELVSTLNKSLNLRYWEQRALVSAAIAARNPSN